MNHELSAPSWSDHALRLADTQLKHSEASFTQDAAKMIHQPSWTCVVVLGCKCWTLELCFFSNSPAGGNAGGRGCKSVVSKPSRAFCSVSWPDFLSCLFQHLIWPLHCGINTSAVTVTVILIEAVRLNHGSNSHSFKLDPFFLPTFCLRLISQTALIITSGFLCCQFPFIYMTKTMKPVFHAWLFFFILGYYPG